VGDRGELIRQAFAAYAGGDSAALERLFAPDAVWVGIPTDETAGCPDRSAIVDRLRKHRENGRRFELRDVLEEGDRVAVAFTILNPAWSGPVQMYKVFTFASGADQVVRMNDCIDESYARQVLAA
jgi:hypothetical protein